ncbi:MAG: chloride channel protein [Myxococcota bacterium]
MRWEERLGTWHRGALAAVAALVSWWRSRNRRLLLLLMDDSAPVDLRLVGKTLMHAAVVGLVAGVVGATFFAALEYGQRVFLEILVGYKPLRAHGEQITSAVEDLVFRPWLLPVVMLLGGLACGLLVRLAPETRGGGADAAIAAFHHAGGVVHPRVLAIKPLASLVTLGTGGSGGREGPTMLIGAAIGSTVGRVLAVTPRERRILLVAGMAAGISAVFRTPLGAALLAVEVLYRDGFEQEALVPAILASVVSYSVVISVYGESTLFAHAPRFAFIPAHLPYYALLAVSIAFLAHVFVRTLEGVRRASTRSGLPAWVQPGAGALLLGLVMAPLLMVLGPQVDEPGSGLGILGSGYGAVQAAISGAPWLSTGWTAVGLLCLMVAGKILASAVTIGSGGSAGDFAPSLVIGGLFGGAFGRALQLVSGDARIDAGAFALVGMGAFYGGVAHVPLSALVLVCEMAGNYDLMVPLMLALGIVFVALRRTSLYHEQLSTVRGAGPEHPSGVLDTLTVEPLMTVRKNAVSFRLSTPAEDMLGRMGDTLWQDVFPIYDDAGILRGMVTADTLRVLASQHGHADVVVAADVMQPAVTVTPGDTVRVAAERLLRSQVRELLVVGKGGEVVGFLDEARLTGLLFQQDRRASVTPLAVTPGSGAG